MGSDNDDDGSLLALSQSKKKTMRKLRDSLQKVHKEIPVVTSNTGRKGKVVKKGESTVKKKVKDTKLDKNDKSVNDNHVVDDEEVDDEHHDEESFGTGCLVCGSGKDENKILLCETCDGEYHIYCLNPPLRKVPKDDWYCDVCVAKRSKVSNTSVIKSKTDADATATAHTANATTLVPDAENEPLKPNKKTDKNNSGKVIISSSSKDNVENDNDALPVARSSKRVNTVIKSTTISPPGPESVSPNTKPVDAITDTSNTTAIPITTTTGAITRGSIMPTKSVPKIIVTPADIMQYDGMDELVSALPSEYVSRFGEIVWAQGGTGYGWWPSIICDPRFMIEPTRSLARKFVGKKFLVHFFRCGIETTTMTTTTTTTNDKNHKTDTESKNVTPVTSLIDSSNNNNESSATTILNTEPHTEGSSSNQDKNTSNESNLNSVTRIGAAFAMVSNKQLKSWVEGLAEELYSGRTAKNSGRYKYELFQEAFAQAMLEFDKPIEERRDWVNVSSTDYFGPSESSSPGAGYPTPVAIKNSSSSATDPTSSVFAPSASLQSPPSKRRLLDTPTSNNVASTVQHDTNITLPMSSIQSSSKKQKHTKKENSNEEQVIKSGTFKLKFAERLPLDQLLTQMIKAAAKKTTS
jgi:PHD-finger